MLAVFSNDAGLVLVGERVTAKGAWQFPQGGIDPGETPDTAVRREMREEIGSDDFDIVAKHDRPIRYRFPPDMQAEIAKRYRGQDQIWFHLRFRAGAGPNLERATDREFRDLDWVTPAEALRRVAPFKKDAYRLGLTALGFAVEG